MRRLRSLLLPEEAACLFSVDNQPLYVLARLRALGQASGAAGVDLKEREIMFDQLRRLHTSATCLPTSLSSTAR